MKNKENTKTKKQPVPEHETAGSELHSGSTIVTKIGGINVKLTKEIIADVFALIMNAQQDGKVKEKTKTEECNIRIIFDNAGDGGRSRTESEKNRQELISFLTMQYYTSLNNINDNDLMRLSIDIIERAEKKQQQLIN
jgi:hypothetical protein